MVDGPRLTQQTKGSGRASLFFLPLPCVMFSLRRSLSSLPAGTLLKSLGMSDPAKFMDNTYPVCNPTKKRSEDLRRDGCNEGPYSFRKPAGTTVSRKGGFRPCSTPHCLQMSEALTAARMIWNCQRQTD